MTLSQLVFAIDAGGRAGYAVFAVRACSRGGRLNFMAEGYCVKCKAKKEIANAVEETMKNGRRAIKGKCPDCGTGMYKILGKAAAPAQPTTPVPPAA